MSLMLRADTYTQNTETESMYT